MWPFVNYPLSLNIYGPLLEILPDLLTWTGEAAFGPASTSWDRSYSGYLQGCILKYDAFRLPVSLAISGRNTLSRLTGHHQVPEFPRFPWKGPLYANIQYIIQYPIKVLFVYSITLPVHTLHFPLFKVRFSLKYSSIKPRHFHGTVLLHSP